MLSVFLVGLVGLIATLGLMLAVERELIDPMEPLVAVGATGVAVTVATTVAFSLQLRLAGKTHEHLREMEHRAFHDELTGLLARDELRIRLDTALRSAIRHDRVVGVVDG